MIDLPDAESFDVPANGSMSVTGSDCATCGCRRLRRCDLGSSSAMAGGLAGAIDALTDAVPTLSPSPGILAGGLATLAVSLGSRAPVDLAELETAIEERRSTTSDRADPR